MTYEEKFQELVDILTENPKCIEIHERFDNWCERNMDYFDTVESFENSSIEYLESLCLEYGA